MSNSRTIVVSNGAPRSSGPQPPGPDRTQADRVRALIANRQHYVVGTFDAVPSFALAFFARLAVLNGAPAGELALEVIDVLPSTRPVPMRLTILGIQKTALTAEEVGELIGGLAGGDVTVGREAAEQVRGGRDIFTFGTEADLIGCCLDAIAQGRSRFVDPTTN